MNATWHTVFVVNPVQRLAKSCQVNSAGQFVAFDGKCTRKQAEEMCSYLINECQKVQLFAGKTVGKFVSELKEPK